MASVTPLESFTHLSDNLPSWLTKLDDLTAQVAEQNARFVRASQFSEQIIRRKHNSTESLRPKANDDDVNDMPPPPSDAAIISVPVPEPESNAYNPPNPTFKCMSQASRPPIAGATNANLIQELKRKRKPGSDARSAASGHHRYRTRSTIVVYYDGAIQEAFESLVRSIATARNNLRKGKVTASFKARMASMDMDENPFSGASADFVMLNPKMMRTSFSRTRLGPDMNIHSGIKLAAFDTADKDLEAAQNLAEVGAHQFLRDGDCRLEIEGMRRNFESVLEIAVKEVERLKLEEEEEKPKQGGTEKEKEAGAEQPRDTTPTVSIEKKQMEPLPITHPTKTINFTGTGAIEVDDGSDAGSVHIDISAFRRRRA